MKNIIALTLGALCFIQLGTANATEGRSVATKLRYFPEFGVKLLVKPETDFLDNLFYVLVQESQFSRPDLTATLKPGLWFFMQDNSGSDTTTIYRMGSLKESGSTLKFVVNGNEPVLVNDSIVDFDDVGNISMVMSGSPHSIRATRFKGGQHPCNNDVNDQAWFDLTADRRVIGCALPMGTPVTIQLADEEITYTPSGGMRNEVQTDLSGNIKYIDFGNYHDHDHEVPFPGYGVYKVKLPDGSRAWAHAVTVTPAGKLTGYQDSNWHWVNVP